MAVFPQSSVAVNVSVELVPDNADIDVLADVCRSPCKKDSLLLLFYQTNHRRSE